MISCKSSLPNIECKKYSLEQGFQTRGPYSHLIEEIWLYLRKYVPLGALSQELPPPELREAFTLVAKSVKRKKIQLSHQYLFMLLGSVLVKAS